MVNYRRHTIVDITIRSYDPWEMYMNEATKPILDYSELANLWVNRVDSIGPIL